MKNQDYFSDNKALWNARTDVHVKSKFYDVEGFLSGQSSLNKIEIDLLGDIAGKNILHLQCHFGMDSISLAKMGAHVTAVDISSRAIQEANQLNEKMGTNVKFIESNVYDVLEHLDETYDLVYSTYGTICWLPDLSKWSRIVSNALSPNGELLLIEFHSFMDMFNFDDLSFAYSYFNDDIITEMEDETYTDGKMEGEQISHCWNHPISEIINNLINQGIGIKSFNEYDYSPYNCFPDMNERAEGEFVFTKLQKPFPYVFALQGLKHNI